MIGKLLITLGALLLAHAGYYSVQYDEYVRILEITDAQIPPVEVMIELVVAFVICLVGVLITSGEMTPIRSNQALNARSVANVLSNPEFHVYNHRAKALHKRIAI